MGEKEREGEKGEKRGRQYSRAQAAGHSNNPSATRNQRNWRYSNVCACMEGRVHAFPPLFLILSFFIFHRAAAKISPADRARFFPRDKFPGAWVVAIDRARAPKKNGKNRKT